MGNPGNRPRVFHRRGAKTRRQASCRSHTSGEGSPTCRADRNAGATTIRPFTIPVTPEADLEALRARVAATRWPDRELVADHSQGVQLAVIQELARYWAKEYDWRRSRRG